MDKSIIDTDCIVHSTTGTEIEKIFLCEATNSGMVTVKKRVRISTEDVSRDMSLWEIVMRGHVWCTVTSEWKEVYTQNFSAVGGDEELADRYEIEIPTFEQLIFDIVFG